MRCTHRRRWVSRELKWTHRHHQSDDSQEGPERLAHVGDTRSSVSDHPGGGTQPPRAQLRAAGR